MIAGLLIAGRFRPMHEHRYRERVRLAAVLGTVDEAHLRRVALHPLPLDGLGRFDLREVASLELRRRAELEGPGRPAYYPPAAELGPLRLHLRGIER